MDTKAFLSVTVFRRWYSYYWLEHVGSVWVLLSLLLALLHVLLLTHNKTHIKVLYKSRLDSIYMTLLDLVRIGVREMGYFE